MMDGIITNAELWRMAGVAVGIFAIDLMVRFVAKDIRMRRERKHREAAAQARARAKAYRAWKKKDKEDHRRLFASNELEISGNGWLKRETAPAEAEAVSWR